jgi:sRNA-binding regulator protein Hfq
MPNSSSPSRPSRQTIQRVPHNEKGAAAGPTRARALRSSPAPAPFRFPPQSIDDGVAQHHAELFYLQKQIQTQTPMVIVLEDGEKLEGQIEWYDRNSLKVRGGRFKALIYKSAIKYMHKLGETGQ